MEMESEQVMFVGEAALSGETPKEPYEIVCFIVVWLEEHVSGNGTRPISATRLLRLVDQLPRICTHLINKNDRIPRYKIFRMTTDLPGCFPGNKIVASI
jgi:hypothetical protein